MRISADAMRPRCFQAQTKTTDPTDRCARALQAVIIERRGAQKIIVVIDRDLSPVVKRCDIDVERQPHTTFYSCEQSIVAARFVRRIRAYTGCSAKIKFFR